MELQDVEKSPLWDTIYKLARTASRYSAKINKNAVSVDDIFQHLVLWALEHWHKIDEWNEQESLPFKLRRTFANEAQKFVTKERAYKSRVSTNDFFYYTPAILHELLRDVWDYEGWLDAPDLSNEFVSTSGKPSEGNNRMALLSDVANALHGLNEQDKNLLRQRYANGGMDFDVLAVVYEMSEEALRKRVHRATKKLQDRLGGEPPIWSNRRRKIKSNAQARAETQRQE